MLRTQHAQLHAATKQTSYRLVKEQIEYYQNNFSLIGTQAALMAGFSFSLLGSQMDSSVSGMMFVLFSGISITFNIMAVSTATLCGIRGPRLGET